LLTATVAGTLLGALWFVPSANATQDEPVGQQHLTTMSTRSDTPLGTAGETGETAKTANESVAETSNAGTSTDTSTGTVSTTTDSTTSDTRLADTGSVNTTPYVVGGTLFLGLGAGFVAFSVRRERMTMF
jgi:LPXTG-motif cell wall-anchored protein